MRTVLDIAVKVLRKAAQKLTQRTVLNIAFKVLRSARVLKVHRYRCAPPSVNRHRRSREGKPFAPAVWIVQTPRVYNGLHEFVH